MPFRSLRLPGPLHRYWQKTNAHNIRYMAPLNFPPMPRFEQKML